MSWAQAAADCERENRPFVLITVLQTQGSTPRDSDAKMLVHPDSCIDSIGGGQLEFSAIETARQLLLQNQRCTQTRHFNLGKDLEQCCGGQVELLFECFPALDFNIVLFGAGHVGSAIIHLLQALPCRVRWLDSREQCVPDYTASNVDVALFSNAEQAVEACAAQSYYLVMTHSHVLDQQLVEAIISRGDAQYCGLIGSESKAASFRGRLKRKGFSEQELSDITSPVGLPGLKGKQPMEIAVSVVAQLLQLHQQ